MGGFGIDNRINKPSQLDTPWQHRTIVDPNMITRSRHHENLTKQNLPQTWYQIKINMYFNKLYIKKSIQH